MPFDEAFAEVYRLGIQDACSQRNVLAQRVDDQIYTETILERIYRQIDSADFIIADMTGRNPNVFYEVGYAHAKKKLCLLLTQNAADIPFDLKHHRHIVYGNISQLRSALGVDVDWCLAKLAAEKAKPITAETTVRLSYFDRLSDQVDIAKVDLVVDLHNPTDRVSPDIDAIYLHSKPDWTYTQDEKDCPKRLLNDGTNVVRHFVRSPVTRLAPGAWAQIRLHGEKTLWTKWSGVERQEQYKIVGRLRLEVSTASASYSSDTHLALDLDEIPF